MRFAPAALALAAIALTGCETTAEKAAKLERAEAAHAHTTGTPEKGLSITRVSSKVTATSATVVQSSEGAAVVVTLQNSSGRPLRNVPVEVDVSDVHGKQLYANTVPGLAPALISAPLVPAHGRLQWVDDQVQASGAGLIARAKIGEGARVSGASPKLKVEGAHVVSEAGGASDEGTVRNLSAVAQRELVVYAVATQAGKTVAAGRAILPSVPAHGSAPFQLFFIGSPAGATLALSAPPTTFG